MTIRCQKPNWKELNEQFIARLEATEGLIPERMEQLEKIDYEVIKFNEERENKQDLVRWGRNLISHLTP